MKKILSILCLFLLIPSLAFGANQWRESTGAESVVGTINPGTIDTNMFQNVVDPLDRLLSDYRKGATLQFLSASTLRVTLGQVMVENSSGSIRLMQDNTSNTTVTWSNIDTGAEASSTKYYIYAVVATATDSTFTIKISASASSPSGSTYFALLGSFFNNSDGNIEQIDSFDNSKQTDYDSGWFSVVTSTSYTKPHSLGVVPNHVEVVFKALLADPVEVIQYEQNTPTATGGVTP